MAEDIKRKISIFINDREVKDSLGGIGREIGKIKRELKETSDPEERKRLNKELQNTRKRYGEIKEEINDTNVSLQDARGHFDNLLTGLVSGDLNLAKEGLKGITSGIKSATKSAVAFIATPIGIFITALAGIGFATKLWADYNIELYKATKFTKQLTGLTGEAAREIRDEAQGLAESYDKDFNEVLRSANSLAKQMGISHSEAMNLITQGFARGADVNGDFLEKVKEYPVQFKNAGYSAQEFIDLATQEAQGGIFSDKLLDTLKEADLALKEMTASQKEALENAFGSVFTNDLSNKIRTGELSTKKAIESIISESNRLGLDLQQKQQLLADVFKGAGEDVGGFNVIVEQLTQAFDEQNKTLDESELASLRLVEANKEQKKALSDLFDVSQSGFPTMLTNIKAIGKEIFTNFLRGIKLSTTSLKQLISVSKEEGSTQAINDVVEDMKRFGSSKEDAVKYKLETTQKNIDRVKKQITEVGFFGHKILGTDKTLQTQLSKYIAYKDELLKIVNDTSKKFKDAEEGYINPDDPKPGKNSKSTEEDAKLKAYQKAEEELDKLIAKKKEERAIQQKEGIEKELASIDAKYAALEEKYVGHEDKLKELTALKEQEKADLLLAKKEEYLLKADEIEEQNRLDKEALRLEREAEKAVTDEQKQILLLDKAKFIADAELEIELNKELAKVEAVEGAEQLKQAIRDKYLLKQQKSDEGFIRSKKTIQKDEVNFTSLTEQQKFGIVSSGLNQSAEAFNKGSDAWKGLKISETVMSTFEGAQSAFTSLSKIPIIGPALGVTAAIAATKAGLSRVSQIKNTKLEKMPTFFYGGFTGNKAIGYDKYGAIVGGVHEEEWVGPKIMTQNPKYAANFAYLEAERMRLQKGYFNGGFTSNKTTNDTQNPIDTTNNNSFILNKVYSVLNRLASILENGIVADASFGYEKIKSLKEAEEEILEAENYGKIS